MRHDPPNHDLELGAFTVGVSAIAFPFVVLVLFGLFVLFGGNGL